MHLIKSLSVGAACVALAVAQSGRIAITAQPSSVTPGERVTIGWGGGDPTSTNIKLDLYQGTDINNLEFVRTLTSTGSNGSDGEYVWTVPSDLPNRNDYSLQIAVGVQDNYSGPFQLRGSDAVSSASSSSSATSSSEASSSSSSSPATVTTSGGAAIVQTVVTSNTTMTDNNATTTMMMTGTGVGASGSAATGTAMMRNTTMSRPTLSGTSTEAAATTEGSASEPTSGGSTEEEAPSSGAVAMEVASFASPLALVLSAVAAIMFLA
ncbi:MAG: hypothetical protein Q9169_007784 [Polycauliona sp. 2 TL-2023]